MKIQVATAAAKPEVRVALTDDILYNLKYDLHYMIKQHNKKFVHDFLALFIEHKMKNKCSVEVKGGVYALKGSKNNVIKMLREFEGVDYEEYTFFNENVIFKVSPALKKLIAQYRKLQKKYSGWGTTDSEFESAITRALGTGVWDEKEDWSQVQREIKVLNLELYDDKNVAERHRKGGTNASVTKEFIQMLSQAAKIARVDGLPITAFNDLVSSYEFTV